MSVMYQVVDATQVHEHSIGSDVFDRSFENLSDFETLNDETLLLFQLASMSALCETTTFLNS